MVNSLTKGPKGGAGDGEEAGQEERAGEGHAL